MSGICGLVGLDARPIDQAGIDALVEPLRRRGPDGARTWRDGAVALGHTLLATTPEALVERLPFTHAGTGCTITADVRLDNRDDLLAALGLAGAARLVGDGELILHAYLKWGEACPARLLGDFAFAIWDPRNRQLFCARDQMGMRQFIYTHRPGQVFAFATQVDAILALPGMPARINEGRIADFLDDREAHDLVSTFYEGIFCLPPASTLALGPAGMELRRYWELSPQEPRHPMSDADCEEEFLDIFSSAVNARLRSAGTVGSMLSGGLDSGSVVAIASELLARSGRGPLKTFSAVGPDAHGCIETRMIRASARMPGLETHFANYAELGPYLEDLASLGDASADPFDTHMTLPRLVYLMAHRAGIKVMLDGVAGDLTLMADSQVPVLLRQGRFRAALREAQAEERFRGGSVHRAWKTVVPSAVRVFAPGWLKQARRSLVRPLKARSAWSDSPVSPHFARRIDIDLRRRDTAELFKPGPASGAVSPQQVPHPYLVAGRERYDRVASALAIEPRDPFLDLRLVSFCASLPAGQLRADGWPKYLLRRAMAGRLPDEVRWRRGRQHLGYAYTMALLGWRKPRLASDPLWLEMLEPYASAGWLGEVRRELAGEVEMGEICRAVYLGCWLRANKQLQAG